MRLNLLLAVTAVFSKNCVVKCKYRRKTIINEALNLTVTTNDFLRLRFDDRIYIDKSLLIEEILQNKGKHPIILRPPKFGKTVNMKMLETFFKIPDNEHERLLNRKLFLGGDVEVNGKTKDLEKLKITDHADIVEANLGKYPVIYLSFKNCSFNSADDAKKWVRKKFDDYYRERAHQERPSSMYDGDEFMLYDLIKSMYKYYKRNVIVLIDDYDYAVIKTFLFHGSKSEEFKKINHFFTWLFEYAGDMREGIRALVTTGIIPLLGYLDFYFQEYPVFKEKYSPYFGFTEDEVDQLFTKFPSHRSKNVDTKNCMKGLYIGDHTMYNPSSILNCLRNDGAFSSNVDSDEYLIVIDHFPVNSIWVGELYHFASRGIHQVVNAGPRDNYQPAWHLVDNDAFNYLIYTGYVNAAPTKESMTWFGQVKRNCSVTNSATKIIIRRRIVEWITTKLNMNITPDHSNELQDHLIKLRLYDFSKSVEDILHLAAAKQIYSGSQQYYIDVLEGLITYKIDDSRIYYVDPNKREKRVDIVFAHSPRKGCVIGVILVIQFAEEDHKDTMEKIAEQGLRDISQKDYETELYRQNPNVQYILKLSLSFRDQIVGMKSHIEKTDRRGPDMCEGIRTEAPTSTRCTENLITTTRHGTTLETKTFKYYVSSNLPAISEVPLQYIENHLSTSEQNKVVFKQYLNSHMVKTDINKTVHHIRSAIIHQNFNIAKRSSLRKLGFRIKYGHIIEAVVEVVHQWYNDIGLSHILETVEEIFDHSYGGYSEDKFNTEMPIRKSSILDSGLRMKSNSD